MGLPNAATSKTETVFVNRRGVVTGACLVVMLLVGGCGSGAAPSTSSPATSTSSIASSSPSRTPTDLPQALAAVRDSPTSRRFFAWSDLAAVRQYAGYPSRAARLNKATANKHWAAVFGLGTAGLSGDEPNLTTKTGVDILAADRAIQIGVPPTMAIRIDGPSVNAAAITRALTRLGAKRQSADGRTFLAFGAQRSVNLNSALVSAGILDQLDRSIAQNHTFAAGSAVAPLVAVLGGSPSLAADPPHRSAAACLGNVVAAIIASPRSVGTLNSGSDLVAIGDLRPANSTAAVTEILCTIDPTASIARRQSAQLKTTLGPSGQVPLVSGPEQSSAIVRSLSVTVTKQGTFTVLRAVIGLRPSQPAGLLENLLGQGNLGALIGGGSP